MWQQVTAKREEIWPSQTELYVGKSNKRGPAACCGHFDGNRYKHNDVRMRTACGCLTRGNTNWIIRKYTEIGGDFWDFRFQRFQHFLVDFEISCKISRLKKKDFQPSLVRLRTVSAVLARALLKTTYRAYLWSIGACTVTSSHSSHIQATVVRPHGCNTLYS